MDVRVKKIVDEATNLFAHILKLFDESGSKSISF